MSIFSPGFHDYPGFPWPASTLMRLHVLQTASISKEYMPQKTYTVGNIQHIFSRVKFNTPGVIEPGFCSYSIHHRWWVILTVCLAAFMNPSTPSQSAYYSYNSRKEKHMTSPKVIPMKYNLQWDFCQILPVGCLFYYRNLNFIKKKLGGGGGGPEACLGAAPTCIYAKIP